MKLLQVIGKNSVTTIQLNLDICRVCMESDEIVSIHNVYEGSKISDVFTTITGIEIDDDDNLPLEICTNCLQKIKDICDFKKLCLDTDTKLREMVSSSINEYLTVVENSEYDDVEAKNEEVNFVAEEVEYVTENEFNTTDNTVNENDEENEVDYIEEEYLEDYDDNNSIKAEYLDSIDEDEENIVLQYEDTDEEENIVEDTQDQDSELSESEAKEVIRTDKEIRIKFEKKIVSLASTSSNPQTSAKRTFRKSGRESTQIAKDKLKGHQCTYCGKTYQYQRQLQDHLNVHTGNRPYECKICKKRFYTQSTLHSHGSVHTEVKQYKCDICNREFSRSNNFKSHLFLHTGIKPHSCEVCGKAFKTVIHLRGHMRVHTGEKPYKCDSCDKAYSHYTDLKRHKYTHTGERPYRCEVCDKGFTKRSNLDIHMQTHSGEKPHGCYICNKKFSQPSMLKTHLRQAHES